MVVQAALITLANVALIPYQYFPHPNNEFTVMVFPDVLRNTPEHAFLVACSLVLFFLFVVPFNVCVIAAAWQAYAKRDDAAALARVLVMFKLFFGRWRARGWLELGRHAPAFARRGA